MEEEAQLHQKSLALAEEYTVGLPITLVPISFKMNQNASDKLLHERNNLSEKQAKNNFGQNMEISDINSKVILRKSLLSLLLKEKSFLNF
ncbi:hypothetical protein DdX_08339 [Ditylenchus destructor]|uniref:Uncharacterized protein n=1 Tax=Ditylenchus destructor TaxID=166010 RepID=A0AAD4R7D2_9BILA|nr:hypothetical protein DdX_08339 [Ditylenchus destructor]